MVYSHWYLSKLYCSGCFFNFLIAVNTAYRASYGFGNDFPVKIQR
jgi:hypothetical protein